MTAYGVAGTMYQPAGQPGPPGNGVFIDNQQNVISSNASGVVNGGWDVCLGQLSNITGSIDSVAIGLGSRIDATADLSVALGSGAHVGIGHNRSVALGQNSGTDRSHQIMLGAAAGGTVVDIAGPSGGLAIRSPDGTRYRISVDNAGALVITATP